MFRQISSEKFVDGKQIDSTVKVKGDFVAGLNLGLNGPYLSLFDKAFFHIELLLHGLGNRFRDFGRGSLVCGFDNQSSLFEPKHTKHALQGFGLETGLFGMNIRCGRRHDYRSLLCS